MHKAISTKVQGKTCFETKLNNVDQTFWIFYFLCVFGFLTQKQERTDQKQQCKNIQNNCKQTHKHNFSAQAKPKQKAHNQSMSQSI